MNNRALAKQKNLNSTTFLPVFDNKLSGRTFTPEPVNEARYVSSSEFGHNFGDVQVESPSFKPSCPLSLSGPAHCPFGGVSHTCPPRLQTKLKIGQPGDKYEQEADLVAEQVMRMPESQVQRKACSSCNEYDQRELIQAKSVAGRITPLVQRQVEEEEEEEEILQTKDAPGQSPGVPRDVQMNINNLRGADSENGKGHSLPDNVKEFMESSFVYDFSSVRIHTNSSAVHINRELGAKAFTFGSDVYFNQGQYNPNTNAGRLLLAHELTHVAQQSSAGAKGRINLKKRAFVAGRAAHNHKPGKWAAVQKTAKKNCTLLSERGRIECVCAKLPPIGVIAAVLMVEMSGKPLAKKHLLHYLNGGGKTYNENKNLTNLIKQDSKVRSKLGKAISGSSRGHESIWQGDYSVQDFRYAFGGIDRVDFEVDKTNGTVDIWFKDRYDFHPAGFGYKNKGPGDDPPPGRITNCVHAAAVELKSMGSAADYWMKGEASFQLSLFKPSSAKRPGSGVK